VSQGITNDQLIDLQKTTLANLPSMDFEYALKYQDYLVVNEWFQKEKVQEESGTSIERNIVLDHNGNARHVRLYQKTSINQGDTQRKVTAPWVQVQSHYAYERREALRNRKPSAYINLLKSKRIDGMVALAELLEDRAWQTPLNASDDLNPRGLPYWLVKAGSGVASTGGFIGKTVVYGDATTATSIGGIDANVESRWRNYAATYDNLTSTGTFTARLRKAFHATQFRSPMTVSDLKMGPLSKYRLYSGLDTLVAYEELVTNKNTDNLGADIGKFHGVTAFNRVPLMYAPPLDADADGVVYGVNHAKFFPITQSGDWMRESEPMKDVEMHNVIVTFIDGSYNFFCSNRRTGGFVVHTQQA
jgi:hypothetical protein